MNSNSYISVGIDVGSTISLMSIVDPQENIILKPIKIIHNDISSLERAIFEIKKAEELYSLKSRTFLESTGIYHFPLFCFLIESGFEAYIINPLITHSIKNYGIRKVKNDKIDSIVIAKLGLKRDLKTSVIPFKLVLELRSLCRKYYELTDTRSSYVNRLKKDIHTVFPQYLDVFCNVTGKTSIMILKEYPTPDKILRGHKITMIEKILKTSKKGINHANNKYEQLIQAAKASKIFGCDLCSVYLNISINIKLIEELDALISFVFEQIKSLIETNQNEKFIKQINLLDSIPGIGFLSAVTIMCEIGDFSAFKKPKQLIAYFGIDPTVYQSGNFKSTEVHMSKRGSRIARRAIFSVAIANIRSNSNGNYINPVLYDYYIKKTESKPKKVALGAVMHKICNLIFAVLRDEKPFVLKSSEEHCLSYKQLILSVA